MGMARRHDVCGSLKFLLLIHSVVSGLFLFLPPLPHVSIFAPSLPIRSSATFAQLGRPFSGAYSDVLAGASSAFSEIRSGVARVQGHQITCGSGRAFSQTFRALAGAFANILSALADFLARAGLNLLLLSPGRRLRLRGPSILSWMCGAGQRRDTQKQQNAYRLNS